MNNDQSFFVMIDPCTKSFKKLDYSRLSIGKQLVKNINLPSYEQGDFAYITKIFDTRCRSN